MTNEKGQRFFSALFFVEELAHSAHSSNAQRMSAEASSVNVRCDVIGNISFGDISSRVAFARSVFVFNVKYKAYQGDKPKQTHSNQSNKLTSVALRKFGREAPLFGMPLHRLFIFQNNQPFYFLAIKLRKASYSPVEARPLTRPPRTTSGVNSR